MISEPTKPHANQRVMSWLNRQRREQLYLTSINLAELAEGVELLPDGRRKSTMRIQLQALLAELVMPDILPFDREAAWMYALVKRRAKANQYTLPVADGQIAAIAAVHWHTVLTRDVEPFVAAGVKVINPWEFNG
jgi:predicted nucleic acid-binding protein